MSILLSSNGASTSSKIQKGAGFNKYIANNKEVAVNVFSPPDNWFIEIGFFPFGLANISILDSKGLLWSDNNKSQSSFR